MIGEFLAWYGQQMAALLPTLSARRDVPPDGLVLVLEAVRGQPQAVRALARRKGRETPVGRHGFDPAGIAALRSVRPPRLRGPTILRVPRGTLLERLTTLPLAAEAALDRVVQFEMDRFTPFTASEVIWGAAVRSRDRLQGKLQAAITLTPRSGLAQVLAVLDQAGLRPDLVEGETAQGETRRITVAHDREGRDRTRRLGTMALATCCLALAFIAIVLPFVVQGRAEDAIEARIASVQPRVTQAEALRRKLADDAAGSDALAAEQTQVGRPLEAIAALTQILPDDTFLTALVLHQRQLSIEGQSANAARLIGSLSSDPVIRNAAFAAPVTRSDSGADLFSIKAEVRP